MIQRWLDSIASGEVLAEVVAGVFMLIALFWQHPRKLWKGWKRRREQVSMAEHLERGQKVRAELESILAMPGVSRVLYLAGHNCGGLPKAGSPFYVTAIIPLHDGAHKTTSEMVGLYQHLTVDAHYMQMLLDVRCMGVLHLVVDQMPECQIKTYYINEGIRESLIYYIDIQDARFQFVSVARHDGSFTPQEQTKIGLYIETIRNLVRTIS